MELASNQVELVQLQIDGVRKEKDKLIAASYFMGSSLGDSHERKISPSVWMNCHEKHQAVTKDLTSSSTFSGSCVLTFPVVASFTHSNLPCCHQGRSKLSLEDWSQGTAQIIGDVRTGCGEGESTNDKDEGPLLLTGRKDEDANFLTALFFPWRPDEGGFVSTS